MSLLLTYSKQFPLVLRTSYSSKSGFQCKGINNHLIGTLYNFKKYYQTMQENILTILHKEFGEEQFLITNAQYNIYESEEGFWEFLITFETKKALKRAKALEEIIDVHPNIETAIVLSKAETKFEEGKRFFQEDGYDNNRDEYLTNIYYFGHETVENLEVKIIEVEKKWIKAELQGEAVINNYAEGKPDVKLNITPTKFILNKKLERSFL